MTIQLKLFNFATEFYSFRHWCEQIFILATSGKLIKSLKRAPAQEKYSLSSVHEDSHIHTNKPHGKYLEL